VAERAKGHQNVALVLTAPAGGQAAIARSRIVKESSGTVLRRLQAAPSFPHHVIFSTMYGTGMRVSETVHLRAADIDSQRMMIQVEQGKGHKDRYVQLSSASWFRL
jgi:site-specific recombinase XerD